MSNQSTELQPTEANKDLQASPPDIKEVIKTGGSAVGILTALIAFIAWLSNLSPLLFIPLIGVSAFILFLIFYYFWIIPKFRKLQSENASLKEIREQETPLLETKTETEKHESIVELVNERKTNFTKYISVTKVFFCYAKLDEKVPYIHFGIHICNDSLIEIVIDEISGYIEFDDIMLSEKIINLSSSSAISPLTNEASLTIKQRITPAELPALENFHSTLRGKYFRVKNLTVKYKGSKKFPKIQSHELTVFKEFAEDNEPAEVIELKDEIIALRKKHKTEIDNLETYYQNKCETLQKESTEHNWLFNLAKEQSKNIDTYIVFERIDFVHSNTQQFDVPHISFQMLIINTSVFDIVIDEKLGGDIFFRNTLKLRGHKWIEQPPKRIKPYTKEAIWVFLQLNSDEIQFIETARKAHKNKETSLEPEFQFGELIVTIKGFVNYPYTIDEKPLKIMRDAKASIEGFMKSLVSR